MGYKKTPELVLEAFESISDLSSAKYVHTDRGSKFKNHRIDELSSKHQIARSLSHKGYPYDNTCMESLYSTIKTEFVKKTNFNSLESVRLRFFEYVNWYNKRRIHSTLGYMTPKEYKRVMSLILKMVSKSVDRSKCELIRASQQICRVAPDR